MVDLIIIVSISIAFVCLFFLYLKNKKMLKDMQSEWEDNHSQLKLSHEVEEHLRDELSMVQQKLQSSFEDSVTHLLGWHVFEDRVSHAIKESERYQLTMGVLFVDIDDFKVINEALSHEVGDLLLAEAAKRLETCIRQVDSLTRFTKDTFVILLSQLVKPETAVVVAQRILQAFQEIFIINHHELLITVSIGIAIYPNDGQTTATLLRSADHALHLAKTSGKHTYKFYQERLHIKSVRELAIYTSLSRENVFSEFTIYYQPIRDVLHECIYGMEALLHWQHDNLGLIPPEEIFTYAEKQRRLNAITEWLIETACKQFLKWRALGFSPPHVVVSINIKQLENSQFVYRISHILQEISFNPNGLILEIKRTGATFSKEASEKALNMLKYLGVRIAIANFASDESLDLLSLKSFSIDYLKLDPGLIQDINDEKTLVLIQSLIYLAKKLNLELIVQGVETEEQIQVLKNLKLTLMEGAFLGLPLSEREVTLKMVSAVG